MCNIWRCGERQELCPEEYALLPIGIRDINITGGEPFLREDLHKIISVIWKRCDKPRIVISTNGLNPTSMEQQLKEIINLRIRVGVRISVDGIGEIHNRVRGVDGAFDLAMESAEVLKKLKIADAGLAFTILEENLDQLEEVYDLSRKIGFQFAVSIAQNSKVYFHIDNIQPVTQKGLLQRQMERIITKQLRHWDIKDWFRAYHLYWLYHYSIGRGLPISCSAADDFFFLAPDGDVYICPVLDMKLGNICETSFNEIWASDKTAKARQFATTCQKHCWMICTVTPFIRTHIHKVLCWIFSRKIFAHLHAKVIKT